jgi:hypothetical protein
MRSSKRPTDANQLAKLTVDIIAGAASDNWVDPEIGKNAAVVALGRLGGRKGGKARAAALSPNERSLIAAKAATKRWGKDNE